MKKYKEKNWLYTQYVDNKKSTVQISEICNVSPGTISYWLEKFEINSRNLSESLEGRELSDESKNKIAESVSEHLEENGHPFEGETQTDEAKEIMSEKQSGENNNLYNESRPEFAEQMTGSESEIHTHHAKPVSSGGAKYDNTFIVLCKQCHKTNYEFWHNSSVEEQLSKVGR